MVAIKAIETRYKGYHFRSRLEARWAVFFDALGVKWTYEEEGFENDYGDRYLPDFTITQKRRIGDDLKFFAEVKGDPNAFVKDHDRMVRLLDFGGVLPGFADSGCSACFGTPTNGLFLLGEIPDASEGHTIFHPLITHRKGLSKYWASFYASCGDDFSPVAWTATGAFSLLCGIGSEDGLESSSSKWDFQYKAIKLPLHSLSASDAYIKARSARFEHNGKVN